MRTTSMIVGMAGGLLGFAISFFGFFAEVIFVFSDLGGVAFILIEAALVLFSLVAFSGSLAVIWRPRLGTMLLGASFCGFLIFGYLQLPPAPISEILQYVSPMTAPIVATPLLLAATVLALVATRTGRRSMPIAR